MPGTATALPMPRKVLFGAWGVCVWLTWRPNVYIIFPVGRTCIVYTSMGSVGKGR